MSNWNEITCETYLEVFTLQLEGLTSTEYWLEVIAILLEQDVEDLTDDEFDDFKNQVRFIQDMPPTQQLKQINGHELKPFSKLTFGELIDCNKLISNGYPIENVHKVNAILYGGQSDFLKVSELMLHQPIAPLFHNLEGFIDYSRKLSEQYSELFDIPEEDEEQDEEEQQEPQSVFAKWSWEKMIWDLCNGDITRAREVTSLPHIMVLNWVLMEKELKLRQQFQTAAHPLNGAAPI
jgi:hypothetical protein